MEHEHQSQLTREQGIFVADLEAIARCAAREEIASLCGFMLRRLQVERDDIERVETSAGVERHTHAWHAVHLLSSVWGEALRDFSQTKAEPGPKEADDGA